MFSTLRRIVAAACIAAAAVPTASADEGLAVAGTDYEALHVFFESLERIQGYYVEELTTEELVQLAIDGVLAGLDEHSRFLGPEAFSAMRAKTRGSFSGIGVVVALRGGTPTVVSPIDGSPAARAGIRAGDRLVYIDDAGTRGASLDTVVTLLRGQLGSIARIGIEREGIPDPIEYELERAEVALESVIGPIYPHPDVAYIRIGRFSESTATDFTRALDEAEVDGARALVLDLRDNPGGLLAQGVDVAERFVPVGRTIVEVRSRNQVDTRVYRSGVTRKWTHPVAVLVDGGTASAAEIVAGAIRDHHVGPLVGEETFGKGSVQSVFSLDGGKALKLTTALYYTPNGTSVEPRADGGAGLTPDVIVDATQPDSVVTALTLAGAPTAFVTHEGFSDIDFSIPLKPEVIERFRSFAGERYAVGIAGADDAEIDRCLRAEIALRDGGTAAVLALELPRDPQFTRAVAVLFDDARVVASATGDR